MKTRFEIEATLDAALKNLGELRDSMKEVVTASDNAGESMKKAGAHASAMEGKLSEAGAGAKEMFTAMLGASIVERGLEKVAESIGSITSAMIGGNAQMEQYMTSFEVMIGNTDGAKQHLSELAEFGAASPFELPGLAKNSAMLQSFGVAVADILPTLQMLGDISQGDQVKLDGLALVFAQVRSAGKLQGQDLMQMINQGFNPLSIMAEKSGKSMAELKGQMEKGLITFDMVQQSFKDATGEGGKFHGMMQKQAATFTGLKSTLEDTFGEMGRTIGKPMFDSAKEGLIKVLDNLGNPGTKAAVQGVQTIMSNMIMTFQNADDAAITYNRQQTAINDRMIEFYNSSRKAIENIPTLAREYENLAGKTQRTKEENERMNAILKEISAAAPGYISSNTQYAGSLDEVKRAADGTQQKIGELAGKAKELNEQQSILARRLVDLNIKKAEADLREFLLKAGGASKEFAEKLIRGEIGAEKQVADQMEKYADKTDFTSKQIYGNLAAALEKTTALKMMRGERDAEIAKVNAEKEAKAFGMYGPHLSEVVQDKPKTEEDDKAKKERLKRLDDEFKAKVEASKREDELFALSVKAKGLKAEEEQDDIFRVEKIGLTKRIGLAEWYERSVKAIGLKGEDMPQLTAVKDAKYELEKREAERLVELAKKKTDDVYKQGQTEIDQQEELMQARFRITGRTEEAIFRMQESYAEQRLQLAIDMAQKDEEIQMRRFALEKMRLDHQGVVAEKSREDAKKQAELDKEGAENKARVLTGIVSNAQSAVGQQSDLYRGLAIAQATMDTYSAANAAMASASAIPLIGWVLGPIAMAAAIAAGLANVNKIVSAPRALAEGGIINKPVFMAGEAGAEVVAPLKDLPGIMAETLRTALNGSTAINRRVRSNRQSLTIHHDYQALGKATNRAERKIDRFP